MTEYTLAEWQKAQVEKWLWGRQDSGIRDLLGSLAYGPRELIELRYGLKDGHHYSVEETAAVLHKSPSWVTTTESYALCLLFRMLEPRDSQLFEPTDSW